jgi:hypothetical protein
MGQKCMWWKDKDKDTTKSTLPQTRRKCATKVDQGVTVVHRIILLNWQIKLTTPRCCYRFFDDYNSPNCM